MSETSWPGYGATACTQAATQADYGSVNRRASALEAALRFCGNARDGYDPNDVVDCAKKFEAFLVGDAQ